MAFLPRARPIFLNCISAGDRLQIQFSDETGHTELSKAPIRKFPDPWLTAEVYAWRGNFPESEAKVKNLETSNY